jgi:hypothetical protein
MKYIKLFESFIKGEEPNFFHIGDLVWAKNMGSKGLVGLVVGKAKFDSEYELWEYPVLFRGFSGEVHPMEMNDIVDILDVEIDIDNNDLYHDITSYKSIAEGKGIELNPKYEQYINSIMDFGDEDLDSDVDTKYDGLVEFIVPDWAMSALINGDFSGMDDEDELEVKDFMNSVAEEFGNAHFLLADEEDRDMGFRHSNDISNKGSNCEKVFIRPSKSE